MKSGGVTLVRDLRPFWPCPERVVPEADRRPVHQQDERDHFEPALDREQPEPVFTGDQREDRDARRALPVAAAREAVGPFWPLWP